jgi:predicted permease
MSLLDALRHRLRPLLRRHEFDREMDHEFRHHVGLQEQELTGTDDDPGARARAHFGSPAYYMEETRRMTPLRWLDPLAQDLRYGWRDLRRSPGFTLVAVLSLAIGIGANSAIFGLLYSLLLQPLPVSHPEPLVEIQHVGPDIPNDLFSYDEYRSLRQSAGFTGIGARAGTGSVPVVVGENRDYLDIDAVDGTFFSTVGVSPLHGRLITPDDENRRAAVVVISDKVWAALFNRAPAAIGGTITMHGNAFTVIGIVPESYQGLSSPEVFQAAVPMSALALVGGDPVETSGANSESLQVIGRIAGRRPAPGHGLTLLSIAHGIPSSKFDIPALFGRVLIELMGGAAIVLLAACANLGTLLLARGMARERDVAVRLSLGASRRRLVTQMLVESALLAIIGTLAGLVLADWALKLIAHRLPQEFSPIVSRFGLHINGQLLGFTAAISVASVLLFGVVPAWRATRTDLIAPLKEGSQLSRARRAGWLDRSLVVAQIVIALVLLNGAGLFVATLRNLRNVSGGFATTRSVSANLDARGTPYESSGLIAQADRLLARAALVPGVRSEAISALVPVYGGRRIGGAIDVEGYAPTPGESMAGWINPVTPGFFSTLGIPLRAGRDFSANDQGAGQQVAVVNEAFVHRYLRARNPIGAIVRSVGGTDTILREIVGVVGDARYLNLRQPAEAMIYVPLAQFGQIPQLGQIPKLDITVRTASDDRGVPAELRSAVLAETPDLRVDQPETMEATMNDALGRETSTAVLAALFGAVALILAAIGLYGVVSYRVARRVREIGVRMALGAAGGEVVWMVLREAVMLVLAGVIVGAPLAVGGSRAIGAELYGLAGESAFFIVGASVLLLCVAVAASAVPARRAAAVDPLVALRGE